MSRAIYEYLDRIQEATPLRSGNYAYRGQKDASWPLNSAASRRLINVHGWDVLKEPNFPKLYIDYHRKTLLEPARTHGFGVERGREMTDLQLLANLQHLGAATGLLDFTWSPLVAIWFACEDLSCDGKVYVANTNDTIQFSKISSDERDQEAAIVFLHEGNSPSLLFWEPMKLGDATTRILRQRSVFIVGRPLMPDDAEVIREITIAKSDKEILLRELARFDIGKLSLYQDIYGFANSNSVHSSFSYRPEDYLWDGNYFYQSGEYNNAIDAYSEYLQNGGQEAQYTLFLRGNAFAALSNHAKAIVDYDDSIERDNGLLPLVKYMVCFNRANSKAEMADYEGALEDYTEAIRLNPSDLTPYFNRANTYADMLRFEEAVDDYKKALGTSSSDTYYNLGNALAALGRFSEALKCYKEAIQRNSDSKSNEKTMKNMQAIQYILDKIDGMNYDIRFNKEDLSLLQVIVGLPVGVATGHQKPNSPLVVGRIGNSGHFSMVGLPGGKGFGGKVGFTVRIVENNSEA